MHDIPLTHVVQPDETLSGIASGYGLDWIDIAARNGIEAPYVITPGQSLTLRDPVPTAGDRNFLGPVGWEPTVDYEPQLWSYEVSANSTPPTSASYFSCVPPDDVCVLCQITNPPCAQTVTIKCHGGNVRARLTGGNELAKTDGNIYFLADAFDTGDASVSQFFQGTPLIDHAEVEVGLTGTCDHDVHRIDWVGEQRLVSGGGGSFPFTVKTDPRSPFLNVDIFENDEHFWAYEAVVIVLDIIINRAVMRREDNFTISPGGSDLSFTSVAVPQLKFIGTVAISPPTLTRRKLVKSEGRPLAQEVGMGARARQVSDHTGWAMAADLKIVVGTNTKEIRLGSYNKTTRRIDSGPSLRKAANKKSTAEKIMGMISDAAKSLAGSLSGERDEKKLLQPYAEGPTVSVEMGVEQAEEQGGPALTWHITAGLSIDYKMGLRIDIYEALKIAAKKHPAGRALVVFLEDAEKGRDLWVASYQLVPELYIDFSVGIGSKRTEDSTGDANLAARYDVLANELVEIGGHISGMLTAQVGGGIHGYFDTMFTDKTVFKYEATVSTTGGITVETQSQKWGYSFWHNGAALRLISMKRVNTSSDADSEINSGRSRSSYNEQTTTSTEWIPDRDQINTYRLAEGWTGPFNPF